jgi:hypothetical protein
VTDYGANDAAGSVAIEISSRPGCFLLRSRGLTALWGSITGSGPVGLRGWVITE